MPRRKTVKLNLPYVTSKITEVFRHNIIFCEKMGRENHPTWVSDWTRKDKDGNPMPKNLPSPEEAARMCAILQVEPEEILTEPSDIELVRSLIEQERGIKKDPIPKDGAVSPAKRKLLDVIDDLTDEQCSKLLGIILEAKKVL